MWVFLIGFQKEICYHICPARFPRPPSWLSDLNLKFWKDIQEVVQSTFVQVEFVAVSESHRADQNGVVDERLVNLKACGLLSFEFWLLTEKLPEPLVLTSWESVGLSEIPEKLELVLDRDTWEGQSVLLDKFIKSPFFRFLCTRVGVREEPHPRRAGGGAVRRFFVSALLGVQVSSYPYL